MDLRQLRSLVHISDCGSLSRAAEIMRTSQPALSLQIKHLETELGVELLHRHARGVTLTDLGRLFCDHVRTILKDIERAKEIVSSQAKSPIGKVSVGLPTSACRGMSAQLIATVAKRYPNISLHIIEAMTGTLDEWVQLGRLDVALLYDHKPFPNVAWTEMMVEDLMLIADSKNPILKRASVRFSELENLPIALPGNPHVLRNVIDRIAVREGITPNIVIDSDSLTAISQLVRSGHMTIMPHFAFIDEIARGEMNAVPIVDPTPSWRLSVVVSQRTINARSSEVVATALAEVIQSMVESGAWRARLRAQGT
ncbi:LysR family transcriptional regulator [Pseudorhodoplanes sinuspersici]|uniref:LysR family transcriptional regulator n=1 Tax=Pseudorhodoplanes sinuspersici TaxID=1235591 RepID=A0A1W6ZRZ1_9HYPH|nr:LysR family transcriptional regulator [Pseudorhodoplanes sinuspersici]ARQ00122.1 LysR family transcriptional regulator [Pseudorhodoplanes sinuspersici]